MATSICLSRRNCAARKPKKPNPTNCSGGLRPPKRLRRSESAAAIQQLQTKTNIELAAVMRAATGEACHRALDLAYASEIASAIRATIDETPCITLRRKR